MIHFNLTGRAPACWDNVYPLHHPFITFCFLLIPFLQNEFSHCQVPRHARGICCGCPHMDSWGSCRKGCYLCVSKLRMFCLAHTTHTVQLHLTSHCTPSPHTAHPHLSLLTLTSHCSPSPLTAHRHLSLHTLTSHCTPSPHTAHPHLSLHILTSHCTSSPHAAYTYLMNTLTSRCTSSPHAAHPHLSLNTLTSRCTSSPLTEHPYLSLNTLTSHCTSSPHAAHTHLSRNTLTSLTSHFSPPRRPVRTAVFSCLSALSEQTHDTNTCHCPTFVTNMILDATRQQKTSADRELSSAAVTCEC